VAFVEKYRFRRYSEKFRHLYRRESDKLKLLLPKNAKIEHVGSTAVNGLRGKGIVDILIAVNKGQTDAVKRHLQRDGYELIPDAGDKERLFFERDYRSRGETRRVHLHLTHRNSRTFIEMTAFRDYLMAHKKEIRKYEEVKRRALKLARGDVKVYKREKKRYIERLTNKAVNLAQIR
jgi:GrpB-like predicted nucleotidyltransferase (UPF0157 family)